MTEKDILKTVMTREFATTLRVIQAFPQAELDFKPHQRSRNAESLLKGFVFEIGVMIGAIRHNIDMDKLHQYQPNDLLQISDDFEKNSSDLLKEFETADQQRLNAKVEFFGREMRVIDILWGMTLDQIHHRGQLSVYIRMAGGRVPSIYGPSADEQPAV